MTSYPPPGQYPPPPGASAYPPPPPAHLPPAPPAYLPPTIGHPADPPRVSPPPPPVTPAAPIDASPAAWLIPLAALLALVGVFTPWFNANGTFQGREILQHGGGLYSFKDGKIGLLAPILLVAVSVSVVGLLRGKAHGRFASGPDPVRSVAKFAIGSGAACAVCLAIAWFLVPGQYHFNFSGQTYSWSKLESMGVSLSRGPQLGYFATIAAAAVAIIGGALMLVTAKPMATPAPAMAYGPPPGPAAPYPGAPNPGAPYPGASYPGAPYPAPPAGGGFPPPPASYPPPTSLEKPAN